MGSQFDNLMANAFAKLITQFGISVTFAPKGGEGVTITGIAGDEDTDVVNDDTGEHEIYTRDLEIYNDAENGIEAPQKGDTVTIEGVEWKVASPGGKTDYSHVLELERDKTLVKQHPSHVMSK